MLCTKMHVCENAMPHTCPTVLNALRIVYLLSRDIINDMSNDSEENCRLHSQVTFRNRRKHIGLIQGLQAGSWAQEQSLNAILSGDISNDNVPLHGLTNIINDQNGEAYSLTALRCAHKVLVLLIEPFAYSLLMLR